MANKSVERFRQLTHDMQIDVLADAVEELNAQADELVKVIDNVAPRGATGHLEHTIRKVPGSKLTIVRVVAGGQSPRSDRRFPASLTTTRGPTNSAPSR